MQNYLWDQAFSPMSLSYPNFVGFGGAGPRPAPGASPGSSNIRQYRNSAPEERAQTERLPHET
jgi:hypothetical protein